MIFTGLKGTTEFGCFPSKIFHVHRSVPWDEIYCNLPQITCPQLISCTRLWSVSKFMGCKHFLTKSISPTLNVTPKGKSLSLIQNFWRNLDWLYQGKGSYNFMHVKCIWVRCINTIYCIGVCASFDTPFYVIYRVCVCVTVCFTYINIYLYSNIQHVILCIYIYMYVCMYVCMYIYIYTNIHVYTHTYVYS